MIYTISLGARNARLLPAAGLSPSGALAFLFIAAGRSDKPATPSKLTSRIGSQHLRVLGIFSKR